MRAHRSHFFNLGREDFFEAGGEGMIRLSLMADFSQPLNLKPTQKKDHCFA